MKEQEPKQMVEQTQEQPKQENNTLTPQTTNGGANVEAKLDMIIEILNNMTKAEIKEPEHKNDTMQKAAEEVNQIKGETYA